MQKSSIVLIALAAILVQSEAKVFTRCGLVKELRKQGFPESKLRNWVCLIEAESSRNTALMHTNTNGSKDHGLFQINDQYWCNNSGTAGKDCNLTCAQVRTDDITKASTCAKKIYNRHGFSAWYGWKNKCQGTLPVISNC